MIDLINSFSLRSPASRPPLENVDSFTHEPLLWRSNLHMEAQLRVGGLEQSYNDQLWNADHHSIFISASKKILICIVIRATESLRNRIVLGQVHIPSEINRLLHCMGIVNTSTIIP
jgi:hypothetical protein